MWDTSLPFENGFKAIISLCGTFPLFLRMGFKDIISEEDNNHSSQLVKLDSINI
jgi:hypothetical protein